MPTDLPAELQTFSRLVDGQPPKVREYFHAGLAGGRLQDEELEVL